MSKIFIHELGMKKPDINLEVGSGSHGEQTGKILSLYEKVLIEEKPSMIIVFGDVNSTIACSLAAAKLGVPISHVESGLRSFDWDMPEEINRVLTDKLSTFLFTTSPEAKENLMNEALFVEVAKKKYAAELQTKTLNKNNEWRNGVEVDEWGRAIRYAILTKHPGDAYYLDYSANRKLHIFVPAEDIIHLFLPERPGQNRGVPWFHSVMADMHQLQGYEEAAVIRARAGASIMGFIQNDQGELIGDEVENHQRIQSFEPGTFRYLMPNESVTVPDIDYPSQQYEMFVKNKIRRFATGIGCSFETISKDFSETNYSSSRLSLLEDREHWKFCQKYIIDNFHYRIFKEWLDLAVLSGVIDFADYTSNSKRYCKPRWTPPAQHYVCLLYTSPSPRDKRQSRMPSSA